MTAGSSADRPGTPPLWESWSRNGEVWITGLLPPFPGGARMANCLTWLLRAFASRSRRTHDATGALAFVSTGPRGPTILVSEMSLSFDLALQHPPLVRERVRRRGGDPDTCRWPHFWLEKEVYDYYVRGQSIPPGRTPRRKVVVLAEEQQAFVPARAAALAAGIRRGWQRHLDGLGAVDGAAVARLLDEDERAFLANLLVLIHRQPGTRVRPCPAPEDSLRRHEHLVAALSPAAEAKALPISWHALWRLPPAMTWSKPGGRAWMRYPAVSFLAAVRPLRPAE